jgi:hypothetical protein
MWSPGTGGGLNLNNNAVVLDRPFAFDFSTTGGGYTEVDTYYESIRKACYYGYNPNNQGIGYYDGTQGIYSGTQTSNDNAVAWGLLDSQDVNSIIFYTQAGDTLLRGKEDPANPGNYMGSLVVRATYLGDSNVDGLVDDFMDLQSFTYGYLFPGFIGVGDGSKVTIWDEVLGDWKDIVDNGQKWQFGDYNYDGVVDDSNDLQSYTYGYLFQWDPILPGLMVPAAAGKGVKAVSVSAVPEPGTCLLLAIGAVAVGSWVAARRVRLVKKSNVLVALLVVGAMLVASSAPAELMLWIKPIGFSDVGTTEGLPNVEIFTGYDAGGTPTNNPATGEIGNLGVKINRIPAAGESQTITFKVIGAIHGANSNPNDDYMGKTVFDILNQGWIGSNKNLAIGVPSPIALSPGMYNGGTGTTGGRVASTDLTGDLAPDIGGAFSTSSTVSTASAYVLGLSPTTVAVDGRAASTANGTYTNIDIGTFTYTYDSTLVGGTAAQLSTLPVHTTLTGANTMAAWRQDSTAATHNAKKDYSGYKGTNVLSGPAVPILVKGGPVTNDSVLSVNQGLVIDFGRVLMGTQPTKNVELHNTSVNGTSAADWTTIGGIPAGAYGLSVLPASGVGLAPNSDLAGGLNVKLDTTAASVGPLSAAYTMHVDNLSNALDPGPTATISGKVIGKRVFNVPDPVDIGKVIAGTDVTAAMLGPRSAVLASGASDDVATRVLVNGADLYDGTTVVSKLQPVQVANIGPVTAATGVLGKVPTAAFQDVEGFGLSYPDVAVNYTATLMQNRVVTASPVHLGRFVGTRGGSSNLSTSGGAEYTNIRVEGQLFNSATSTGTFALPPQGGSGPIGGSVNLNVQGQGDVLGESPVPVGVSWDGTALQDRTVVATPVHLGRFVGTRGGVSNLSTSGDAAHFTSITVDGQAFDSATSTGFAVLPPQGGLGPIGGNLPLTVAGEGVPGESPRPVSVPWDGTAVAMRGLAVDPVTLPGKFLKNAKVKVPVPVTSTNSGWVTVPTVNGLAPNAGGVYNPLVTATLLANQTAVDLAVGPEGIPGEGEYGDHNVLHTQINAIVGAAAQLGDILRAPVPAGGSLANLQAWISGGKAVIPTTVTLLDGTVSADSEVTMQFQADPGAALPPGVAFITAQPVELLGIPEGDLYAIGIQYDVSKFAGFADYQADPVGYQTRLANEHVLGIAVLNAARTQWAFEGTDGPHIGPYDGVLVAGRWGVDPVAHVAWEVFDHDIVLTVTPEPGTLALLAVSGFGLIGLYIRRKFMA